MVRMPRMEIDRFSVCVYELLITYAENILQTIHFIERGRIYPPPSPPPHTHTHTPYKYKNGVSVMSRCRHVRYKEELSKYYMPFLTLDKLFFMVELLFFYGTKHREMTMNS